MECHKTIILVAPKRILTLFEFEIWHFGKKSPVFRELTPGPFECTYVCPGVRPSCWVVSSCAVIFGTPLKKISVVEFGQFFFKIFDGYITGSLGPAGSQIRKIKILNNFFHFAFGAASKNSAPRQKNTESIALIKKVCTIIIFRVLYDQADGTARPIPR